MNTLTDCHLSDIDFCVVDTETTGGSAQENRIIEIAAIVFRGGEVVDKYHTLINPERPIPLWITHLTGITDEMVRHAPTFFEMARTLKSYLRRGIFTAHNVKFDYGFVQEEFRRLGEDFAAELCCTLKLARHLYPDLPSRSLGVLCDYLLIDIWDRHRAYGDAEATAYILKDLLRKAERDIGICTWRGLQGFMRFGRLSLPDGIQYHQISSLPTKPGVYFLKDEDGKLVFKGETKDIQRRIQNLFQLSNQSDRSNYFRNVVRSIDVLSEN